MKDPPAILDRLLVLPENFNTEAMLEKLQQNLTRKQPSRVITATQPTQTSLSKKKPEACEVQIGGGTIATAIRVCQTTFRQNSGA